MTAEMNTDGLLKIILENGQTRIIYATKIVSNEKESWKYVQSNGRKLVRESLLNPKLWAEELAKEYLKRGEKGEIHWQYKNHTQYEKRVPEEILGSD